VNAYGKTEKLQEKDLKLITGVTRSALSLEYWREYRSFRHIASNHQISAGRITDAGLTLYNRYGDGEIGKDEYLTLCGDGEARLKELEE